MEAGDASEPTAGDHDVLVDIGAAGVNLLDAKIRDGEFKLALPYKAPFVLGHNLAGVVTHVGSPRDRYHAIAAARLGAAESATSHCKAALQREERS